MCAPIIARKHPKLTCLILVTFPSTQTLLWALEVGGGSAGAVMANRLSEDADKQVLLLEAGGSESILTDIPIAAATLQMTPVDWAYQTEPQEAACFGLVNRRSRWPRGRVLGGSSVLNYMLYIRGNSRDYNRWAAEGADGWSWADVFPYFLKSEDNRDETVAANGKYADDAIPFRVAVKRERAKLLGHETGRKPLRAATWFANMSVKQRIRYISSFALTLEYFDLWPNHVCVCVCVQWPLQDPAGR